jgi:geranylgeranyl reductase family protein
LVVGGGPAGTSAAWHLAARGARVVLLERERLPRYKTCGGGVVARALAALPEGTRLDPEHSCNAAEMHFAAERIGFRVRRASPIVAMAMRADLDLGLLERARSEGVRVESPCSLVGFEEQGGELLVHTSRGDFRSRFLIGADGALSTVARCAGLGKPPACAPALEAEVEVRPEVHERFAGTARFDFGIPPGGYAWVFPKRRHLSVGVLAMRKGAKRLKEFLTTYLSRMEIAPIRLELHGFPIPVRPRSTLAAGRVLLVGDAAGLADPLTGEGISHALRSGAVAAAAIQATAHGPDRDPSRVRARFCDAMRREILDDLRAARILAAILYRLPRLRRLLFRRGGQVLCEAVTEVVLGNRDYRECLRSPVKIARTLLFPRGLVKT